QRIVPFRFDIMAIHLNPGFDAENHAPLVEYLAKHGVAGHIEVTDHGPRGHSPENRRNSACFYCAMLRRTRLFEVCQRYGLTHLAFGHNADDLVTTFFMNLVQNGRVEGMGMCDDFFKGALKVIRPLLLVEKPDIIKAARRWELPVWSNPCPSAGKTNRANFQAKIDTLHGGDKMLKTNLSTGCAAGVAQSGKTRRSANRKAIGRKLSVQAFFYSAIVAAPLVEGLGHAGPAAQGPAVRR
ncbi:MAG: ATP-binding protein, partial [Bilophila wadsworthia]